MTNPDSSDIVVVDTDVVSFIFKKDTRAALYKPHLTHRLNIVSAQTRAELEKWTLLHNWGTKRKSELREFLADFFFAAADEEVSVCCAEIQTHSIKNGRPISCADSWVAATALAYDVPLVTHNPNDFINVPNLNVITEK
jgi:predicted nucleic acid-binding protein